MASLFCLLIAVLYSYFFHVTKGNVEYLTFQSCSHSGWSCNYLQNNSLDLSFKCCKETGWHIVVGETPLNLPSKGKINLTIQNCKTVQLSFTFNFTTEKSIFSSLTMKNIVNVTILPRLEEIIMPKVFNLEHIGLIETIRSYSFSRTWSSIYFYNVTIDHVETDSFIHLIIEDSIRWNNVRINVLDTNALNDVVTSEFIISHCYVGILELLSFQVLGQKVIIESSQISDIRFNAIIVVADQFHLVNNTGFNVVMPNAFNVLAREVVINKNYFTYLQTEALERIGPTLIEEDMVAKVTYSFQNNHIEVADIGSLHVSLLEYKQSGAQMLVGNNTFTCSCTHLGWLGLPAPPDHHYKELYEFHKRLLSPEENNTCDGVPCHLSIGIMQELVKVHEVCAVNYTESELCEMFPQPTPTLVAENAAQPKEYLGFCNLVSLLLICLVHY